ncbi:MAG: phospholipid-binding protein MlaC [Syntrophobacteraceae bacterium]
MSLKHFPQNIGKVFLILTLALCIPVLPALAASPSTPIEVVKSGTERAMDILKTHQANGSPSLKARKDEIFQIVDDYFSFKEMARRALGRAWKDQTPEKQQEFVKLFKQLLFNTYIGRVDSFTYSGQKVAYDEEMIEGDHAYVKTRILGYKDADVQVDYRLRKEGGEWKVYDVVVEGISFINNYRQQFDSILANESFERVLARLREKVAETPGS